MNKYKNIFIAVSIATMILINNVFVGATGISDLKTKQNQIQTESKKAKDLLNDTKLQKNSVMATIVQLDADLDKAEGELDFITTELDKTVDRLNEASVELDDAKVKRENQYASLKKRMRYMYENGNVGYLDVLFNATDFSDFINRFEYVNRIVEYDNNLVDELSKTENTISDRVMEIEIKKSEQELLVEKQTEKKHALEVAINQKNATMIKLNENEQSYLEQVAALEKSSNDIEKMIKDAEAKAKAAAAAEAAKKAAANKAKSSKNNNSSANTAVTYNGKLGWPVPGRTNISSDYGRRTSPRTEFHTGIDIPAPTGTNIVAAEAGTVITSRYVNGYGYTIMIDHGGGVVTLYGHNSKLVVSSGDKVSRGQVIAKAGSTGYSTGPHCHFEVRVNGKHTSPWNYLK